MVNVENVNRVADAIEAGELVKRGIGFNMSTFASEVGEDHIDSCRTVACIAGWTYAIAIPRLTARELTILNKSPGSSAIEISATEFLGIDWCAADELFRPFEIDDWSSITPRQAVRVLRHLAKTGKVDWKKAGRP